VCGARQIGCSRPWLRRSQPTLGVRPPPKSDNRISPNDLRVPPALGSAALTAGLASIAERGVWCFVAAKGDGGVTSIRVLGFGNSMTQMTHSSEFSDYRWLRASAGGVGLVSE
jgi:hypothetical protein